MDASTYRFGAFRLEPAARELWLGEQEQALPPKAFGCLVYLIENRDRAVSRDELIDAVWGKEHLGAGILGQAIFMIRRALDDNGDEPRFIKTIRSFGYRWVAPVEISSPAPAADDGQPETAAGGLAAWMGRRWQVVWAVITALVLCLLVAGTVWLMRDPAAPDPPASALPYAAGDIALLLPVTVDAGEHHRWIRFGAMELIADRLRAAGQPMVPSETVIALLGGVSEAASGDDRLHHLATGAALIFGARAERSGTGWRVSLRSLPEDAPPLVAFAEAGDVLDAAREAADRMALYLGLTPAPAPEAERGLALLLQQIEAARLAQQMDVARELIESADAELRAHPEIRFQRGRIEFYSRRLDAAEAISASLLDAVSAADNPVLRARVMNGLASVWIMQGRRDEAATLMEQAKQLLAGADALETLGIIHMNLGNLAQEHGDFAAAEAHFAQAQRVLQGIGDVQRLALLESNMGVLMGRRGRHADALRYYQRAVGRHAAVHNIAGELHAHAGLIEAHLALLDPPAAVTLVDRVDELLVQAASVQVKAFAHISRAALFDTLGERQFAAAALDEALALAGMPDELRLMALLQRVEWRLDAGEYMPATELAREIVDGLADHPHMSGQRAFGALLLIRAYLAQGMALAAAAEVAALSDWAQRSALMPPAVYAALARAEVAAADERPGTAEAAFEQALDRADTGQVSVQLLQVVESYVAWLIDQAGDAERAVLIANRVAGYTDHCYRTALVQLRVYRVLGPPSAWRAALTRAESLAGEREIPPILRTPPPASTP